MNTRYLPLLAACLGFAFSQGFAQTPAPSPRGNTGNHPDGDMREKGRERMRDRLPSEVRERFDAARKKALEDPKIEALHDAAQSASKAFFEAMRAKMTEIDPGLADFAKGARKGGEHPGRGSRKDDGGGMGSLTKDQRQQLMTARETAKANPAVKAAKARLEAAENPAERQAAGEQFREVMNQAILEVDPTLKPVLDQLKLHQTEPPKGMKKKNKPADDMMNDEPMAPPAT